MLVFDKWTCNTNGRQAIFFRHEGEARYRAQMIDQGFCFNAGEWNFPDAPLRGLYARHRVYESVRGIEAFEPWLARIENLDAAASKKRRARFLRTGTMAIRTRSLGCSNNFCGAGTIVRELIVSAWKSSAQPFPELEVNHGR